MLLYQRPACGSLFSTIPKFGQILPFLLLTYSVWTTDKKYLSLAPHLDEKYCPVDTKWRASPWSAPQAPIPFVTTCELKESRRDKALGSLNIKNREQEEQTHKISSIFTLMSMETAHPIRVFHVAVIVRGY